MIFSVVDRHPFDADPDPTFQFAADPDLDPTQVLHMLENLIFFLLFFTALPAIPDERTGHRKGLERAAPLCDKNFGHRQQGRGRAARCRYSTSGRPDG
jgi:hypothetical protein